MNALHLDLIFHANDPLYGCAAIGEAHHRQSPTQTFASTAPYTSPRHPILDTIHLIVLQHFRHINVFLRYMRVINYDQELCRFASACNPDNALTLLVLVCFTNRFTCSFLRASSQSRGCRMVKLYKSALRLFDL